MTDDTNWRDRALRAEAELARVTAEAAVMRGALNHIAQHPCHKPHCPCCYEDTTYAKDALSSTSAGAGLLKRLEAAEEADLDAIEAKALENKKYAMGATPVDVREMADAALALVAEVRNLYLFGPVHWQELASKNKKRADAAEAELARVTAEAAVLRSALQVVAEYETSGYYLVGNAREALSSTSAGAGLLRRLEAADQLADAAHWVVTKPKWASSFAAGATADDRLARELEAWKRARGETG